MNKAQFLTQVREGLEKAREDQAAIYFGLVNLADQVSESDLLTEGEKREILDPLFETIGIIFNLIKTTQ